MPVLELPLERRLGRGRSDILPPNDAFEPPVSDSAASLGGGGPLFLQWLGDIELPKSEDPLRVFALLRLVGDHMGFNYDVQELGGLHPNGIAGGPFLAKYFWNGTPAIFPIMETYDQKTGQMNGQYLGPGVFNASFKPIRISRETVGSLQTDRDVGTKIAKFYELLQPQFEAATSSPIVPEAVLPHFRYGAVLDLDRFRTIVLTKK